MARPGYHPGELLLEEYLKPRGVGQVEAAKQLGVSLNRLNELVLGKRGTTADTALRLGLFLKTSPQLWMRLQADWDLQQAMLREGWKASPSRCTYLVPGTTGFEWIWWIEGFGSSRSR
ncbi:MAG: HigA family addiction module antitoxin [Vicinamibacterales bacterium]